MSKIKDGIVLRLPTEQIDMGILKINYRTVKSIDIICASFTGTLRPSTSLKHLKIRVLEGGLGRSRIDLAMYPNLETVDVRGVGNVGHRMTLTKCTHFTLDNIELPIGRLILPSVEVLRIKDVPIDQLEGLHTNLREITMACRTFTPIRLSWCTNLEVVKLVGTLAFIDLPPSMLHLRSMSIEISHGNGVIVHTE